MKKFISIIMVTVLVLTMTMLGFSVGEAGVYNLDNHTDGRLEVYTNVEYSMTIGEAGGKIDIVSVKSSNGVISQDDIKFTDSKENAPATLRFKVEDFYKTKETGTTLIVQYKDLSIDKTLKKLNVRLDVFPQEIEVNSWADINNGEVYVFDGEDEVEFCFDYGVYTAVIGKKQKSVNLSYIHDVSEDLIAKYPSIVDVIVFKGEHSFNQYGILEFDTEIVNDRFVYELDGDTLVPIQYNPNTQTYQVKTRKLNTYIITEEEVINDEDTVVEVEVETEDDKTVSDYVKYENINANPMTGC